MRTAGGAHTRASMRLDGSDDGNHSVAATRDRDHSGDLSS